jgi:hypothetical protein
VALAQLALISLSLSGVQPTISRSNRRSCQILKKQFWMDIWPRLHESGWDGDTRLARLGYLWAIALWSGATLPGWVGGILDIDLEITCGRPAKEVIAGWVVLCEFLMERADEALHLSQALGMA